MGMVYFITGPPGSGKSTVAERLVEKLPKAAWLDGDRLREGISRDLGYSHEDRAENISRAFSITRMLVDKGCNVVISMVAPVAAERRKFREYFRSYMEIRLESVFERRPDHHYDYDYEESDYEVIRGWDAAKKALFNEES